MTMTHHIRDEMLELRQRALNKLEEEGISSFNPADVERLRNSDRYVERYQCDMLMMAMVI